MFYKKIFNYLSLFFQKESKINDLDEQNLNFNFQNSANSNEDLNNLEDIKNKINVLKRKNKRFSNFLLALIIIFSGIGISCIVYIIIYYVQQVNSKEKDNYIPTEYQQDTSKVSISAMKYLLNRSLSIDFIIKNDAKNYDLSVNGTGWILAKENNTNNYYVATNIHVGTVLTEIGHDVNEVLSSGELYNLKNSKIIETKIGFINQDLINSSNGIDYYHYFPYQISYVNLISTPSIAYMANTKNDENLNNILNSSDYINDSALAKYNNISDSNITASGGLDFMILKMNFDTISNTNKAIFFGWLSNFSSTDFCTTSEIESYSGETNLQSYYMGGFPTIGSNGSSSWVGFSNMTGVILQENKSIVNYIDKKDFTNKQIVGPFSGINYYASTNLKETPVISYSENSLDSSQYYNFNVGQYLSLNTKSSGGSSGSMVIKNTGTDSNPVFKVAGIYWGYATANDNNNLSSGKATLLTSTSYEYSPSISIPSYNIIPTIETLCK